MRPLRTALLVLTSVVCLTGCRTAATKDPVALPPPAPDQTAESSTSEEPWLPLDIHWSRNAAEHRAALIQAYRLAGEVLVAMAADKEPGTWAVALDADETVIDNSLYQWERAKIDKHYDAESWAEWVARKAAPPLPGVMGFLDQIRELGGKIAIVTNRRHAQCPDTEANFVSESIPFDVILCRHDDPRKESRWQQVEEGTAAEGLPPLEIVMWLGDNIGDFPNLDQEIRHQPEVAFEKFGFEYFVLPNPMYGSWEGNPQN